MAALALAMFIALFGFGEEILGSHIGQQQLQLAIFASFVFGIVCGYRTKG